MPLTDYLIQPGEMLTPEAADRKRKIAQALMLRGTDTSPVQHWSQGAARLSDALFGALEDKKVDRQESDAKKAASGLESGLFAALAGGGGASEAAPAGGVAGALGGGDYFSTMASKESAGNPNARNKSGATGLYQFMPGTWRGLMEKNPGLGLTYDGMTDPQQQQVAMQQFTKENAAVLAKAGLPVNNATLALAHQQGAGGAIKLLSNADAPAASVVGKAAVVQNGGDLNMTAGQFAQHVMGYYGFGNNNPTQVAQSGAGYQNMPATPQMAQNGAGYQNAADVAAPGAQPAEFQIPGQPQQQPQQGMGGGQSVAVQQAMRLLNNPYTSPAAKMIAQQVLARAMKGTDPLEQAQLEEYNYKKSQRGTQEEAARVGIDKTRAEMGQIGRTGDINEYEQAKREGYQGDFVSFQKMMKEATRSQVNIDQRAEGAEEKKRGEGMGDRLNSIAAEGGKAQEDAVTFQRFGQLLGNVQTGGKTALLEGIRQMTNGTVTLDPNVDNVQALNAAVQYLAPRLRVPGTGAQSDAELRNFMNSVPTLAGQPGGNKLILDTLQGLVQYKLKRAEIAQAWQSGELSGKEATKRIQALPSPFANLPKIEDQKGDPNRRLPTPVDGWQDVGGGFKIRQK